MGEYTMGLCGLYLLAKLLVRFWVFRPATERPIGLQHRETLQMLDLFAAICLIGAVFILINTGRFAGAIWTAAGLLGYDVVLRSLFLRMEIKRLREKSAKWSYRGARKQVKRRTLSDTTY